MAAIADGLPPSPARDAPGYPEALDGVARRAPSRRADDRYARAEDMRGALGRAAAAHGSPQPRGAAAVIARCAEG